jgi:hypothetical protein
MNKCTYCNKGLRPFKTRFDWNTRQMHKKCYFSKLDDERIKALVKEAQQQYEMDKFIISFESNSY